MKSRGSSKKSAARVGIRKSEHAAHVPQPSAGLVQDQVSYALSWLKEKSTAQDRDNLARFGITAKKAFGVSMKNIQVLAKRLGRSHESVFGASAKSWQFCTEGRVRQVQAWLSREVVAFRRRQGVRWSRSRHRGSHDDCLPTIPTGPQSTSRKHPTRPSSRSAAVRTPTIRSK